MKKQILPLDYIKAIWKRKILFCLVVFVITASAVGVSYLLPEQYRTEAVIMPIASSSNTSSSGMFSLLSGLSFLGGGANLGSGLSNSVLVYLYSNVLRARVVKALDLLPKFFPSEGSLQMNEGQTMNRACEILGGMVAVNRDRIFTEKIVLSVKGEDKEFITQIARQYLVELQNFISDNALTQAKRYRFFLENQIAKNKEELLEMGKMLAGFYGKNPVSVERAKLNVPIALATKEGVRNFKSYEEFKKQFDILQAGKLNNEDTFLGEKEEDVRYVKDVPHQIYLKYLTTQQQILEQDYALLSQSYQLAKLEEAKQEPSFQVLDEPVKPLYRFSPQRKRIAMGAFGFSFFVAILMVFYSEIYRNQQEAGLEVQEDKLADVKEYKWGTAS